MTSKELVQHIWRKHNIAPHHKIKSSKSFEIHWLKHWLVERWFAQVDWLTYKDYRRKPNCRKMWAVMKVRKLVILHGRPKTNFVWLGVTKLAFTRPLLENSHSLSFLHSLKMWTGLKGMASNWHRLNENDVDCSGDCIKMDAKQCTLNRNFPWQSKSLDLFLGGSTRTISISRMADFFAAFFHQLITSDNQNISNDSCYY